ncbi:hypothetical protein P691DRAFT_689512, partial [Macrolepiota fuliginosa MF-IS2]
IIQQVHDEMGHKGIFMVHTWLLEQFWWPMLEQDIHWFIQTCHECQTRLSYHFHIPPTVTVPLSLFQKVYIDTMFMPKVSGYHYIIHTHCSLSSYLE